MKDERANLKVSQDTRRMINLLAAHYGLSQDAVIQKLAEKECQIVGLPPKPKT